MRRSAIYDQMIDILSSAFGRCEAVIDNNARRVQLCCLHCGEHYLLTLPDDVDTTLVTNVGPTAHITARVYAHNLCPRCRVLAKGSKL